MSIPKQYLEEILGVSFAARHKENSESWDPFLHPIIHKQIHGDKVYVQLNRKLWDR